MNCLSFGTLNCNSLLRSSNESNIEQVNGVGSAAETVELKGDEESDSYDADINCLGPPARVLLSLDDEALEMDGSPNVHDRARRLLDG